MLPDGGEPRPAKGGAEDVQRTTQYRKSNAGTRAAWAVALGLALAFGLAGCGPESEERRLERQGATPSTRPTAGVPGGPTEMPVDTPADDASEPAFSDPAPEVGTRDAPADGPAGPER